MASSELYRAGKQLRVMIVSYYGLRDSLRCAADALAGLTGCVLCEDYPLFRYALDANDRREDYLNHFDAFIREKDPDIVLFWCFCLSPEDLSRLRAWHAGRTFALFQWDDPAAWMEPSDGNSTKAKARHLDVAFTCCEESLPWYLEAGTRRAFLSVPGFDPAVHQPIVDTEYACDVSFCLTNLYEGFPHQRVERKALVDQLAAAENLDFRLYGPEHLREKYPRNYRGYATYAESARLFFNSRINVCTHVVGTKRRYLNERSVLVAGCGGLLYVDQVEGIESFFVPGKECILIDGKDPLSQIRSLLREPDRLKKVAAAGRARALDDYTWKRWAENLWPRLRDAATAPRLALPRTVLPPKRQPRLRERERGAAVAEALCPLDRSRLFGRISEALADRTKTTDALKTMLLMQQHNPYVNMTEYLCEYFRQAHE